MLFSIDFLKLISPLKHFEKKFLLHFDSFWISMRRIQTSFCFLQDAKKGNFGLKIHFLGHLIFFLKSLFYRWIHLHVLFRFLFPSVILSPKKVGFYEWETNVSSSWWIFLFFLKPWPLGFLTQKSHKLSRNNYLVFSFSMKRFIQTEKWMMMTHWGKNPFSVQKLSWIKFNSFLARKF